MLRFILITVSFLSLLGCSSVATKHYFEETMQTAKRNVQERESTFPEDFKSGNGNSDDIKKGVKHSTNKSLLILLLSLFNHES